MELEKTNQMNTLFEFYRLLLTDKQQEYMQLYYADDFSLGEIADDFEVSRQAVYDNIKRTENLLLDYEAKLKMVQEFKQNNETTERIANYIKNKYPEDRYLLELVSQLTWGNEGKKGAQHGI